MDRETKESLLAILNDLGAKSAERAVSDERFKRLGKFISECSEYVKHPDEHMMGDISLRGHIDALEQEGLLESQMARVLKRGLELVDPLNPNAEKELYRMAYGPWWKRLFR